MPDHKGMLFHGQWCFITSFNLHGFPVVYSPEDVLDVFDKSGLKYFALENVLVQEIE